MASHPDLGKTRGSEGERRVAFPRLFRHRREDLEMAPEYRSEEAGKCIRRLKSRLFSMLC